MTHAETVRDVAERVALWNEVRTDDFHDQVVRLVNDARESFREGAESELPARGEDELLDSMLEIADVADAPRIAVRDACAHALDVAEESESVRR
jgi:hypothetical protein